jgi:hypothetical protein
MIRIAAYLRSQERGFQPGAELEDWFLAEQGLEPLPLKRRGSALSDGAGPDLPMNPAANEQVER